METSFSELKQKETINICDGKRLGKVCDIAFTYPEGKVLGITVPGGRGFRWGKDVIFIELKHIVKIGEDVVLVELKNPSQTCEPPKNKCEENRPCPPPRPQPRDRRDYGDYE